MNNIQKKRILRSAIAFVCTVTIASANASVHAAPSSEELESKTSGLQSELNNLNSELSSLVNELDETSSKIENLAEEIEQSKLDLASAKLSEEAQYNSMKERIKFMYEGGNVSLLHILFSSKSMADFLNNAEYVAMISNYDRNMLAEYQSARETVELRAQTLEDQQSELADLQANLTDKQNELTSKIGSTSSQLADYTEQLARAKEAEAALAAAQAEEAAAISRLQAENNNSNSSSNNSSDNGGGAIDTGITHDADTSDLALFAAILQAEAGGSGYDGMLAVATVIMNRVESSRYPNNLYDVIYQSGQFAPTWNGSLNRILSNGANSTAYSVAQSALGGERHSAVLDCTQFRSAASTRHTGVNIGGNVFF